MIGWIAKQLLQVGVAERATKPLAWFLIVLAIGGIVALVIGGIFGAGRDAGGAKIEAKVQRDKIVQVEQVRSDERTAADVTASIEARVARLDAKTDEQLQTTIEDLRNAIDAVPPADAGAPLPAAPVDSLREHLNASIARTNRAAEAAAP